MILITHLSPNVILDMTPDQTEIIFEQYIEMNGTSDDSRSVQRAPGEIGVGTRSESVDAETAARVKAEMAKVRK